MLLAEAAVEVFEPQLFAASGTLADALVAGLERHKAAGWQADALVVVEPGEWRVKVALEAAANRCGR
ncbi:MAG: hypothetical protein ACKOHK_10820 [Planctomycetia bacterium]